MRAEPVAGKKIAGEKQVEAAAVKPAVTLRVPRQVNHFQPMPKRQLRARHQRLINRRRAITQHRAANRLHSAAKACRSAIGKPALDVRLLRRMRKNRRAGELAQLREIARVIEVTMREQDGADVLPAEANPLQRRP